MSNRYIWDKRDVKRNLIKYGLILLSCFFMMLVVSGLLDEKLNTPAIVCVCVLIGLVMVVLELWIINLIKKKVEKIQKEKEKEQLIEEIKQKEEENRQKQVQESNQTRKKGTRKKPRNNESTKENAQEELEKVGETDKFEFNKVKNDNVIKISKRK